MDLSRVCLSLVPSYLRLVPVTGITPAIERYSAACVCCRRPSTLLTHRRNELTKEQNKQKNKPKLFRLRRRRRLYARPAAFSAVNGRPILAGQPTESAGRREHLYRLPGSLQKLGAFIRHSRHFITWAAKTAAAAAEWQSDNIAATDSSSPLAAAQRSRSGFGHIVQVWPNRVRHRKGPHRPENVAQQCYNFWTARPLDGVLRHSKVNLVQHNILWPTRNL